MSNGKVTIVNSIAGWIKKVLNDIVWKWANIFSKSYEPFGGDINVKVDLSYYATKSGLINATWISTSKLAAKSDLASLKTEVDKADFYKSKVLTTNLSNLKSKVDKLKSTRVRRNPSFT